MKRIAAVFLLILLIVTSCGDETPRQTVPFAQVNFRVDLISYDSELKNPDRYKIFTEEQRRLDTDYFGYGGVLVVSGPSGDLHAFDLCCPHEDNRQVVVVPDYEGSGYIGKVKCPSCGSVFVTMFGLGSVESGPSMEPLQRYNVILLQDRSSRIVN